MKYRNAIGELERLRADLDAFCSSHAPAGSIRHDLHLCLEEIFVNIVRYAYEPGAVDDIEVRWEVQESRLQVVLADHGRPFDPLLEAPAPDLEAPVAERPIGGLGVHLVKALMDDLHYRREAGCNILTLAKDLGPTPGEG